MNIFVRLFAFNIEVDEAFWLATNRKVKTENEIKCPVNYIPILEGYLSKTANLGLDCEQSLFLFRFSEGCARARQRQLAKPRDARNEGISSLARGHFSSTY